MLSGLNRIVAIPLLLSCGLLAACAGARHQTGISPEQRLHVAHAAETSGDVILARAMYAAAGAESSDDRTVLIAAAEGLTRTGSPADAMALLNDHLTRSPADDDVRRTLGAIQLRSGMPDQALKNLAKVVADRPLDDAARTNQGVALDMLQRHADAQTLYRAVLARTPTDTDAANNLAYSLFMTGQFAAAKAVLAPFVGRTDLPDRLRTTMSLVDNSAAPLERRMPTVMYPVVSAI